MHEDATEKDNAISKRAAEVATERIMNDVVIPLRAQKDCAYAERDALVAALSKCALALGGTAWLAQHPVEDTEWDADWRTIVVIKFTGGRQMGWHIHESERYWFAHLEGREVEEPYDGHSTAEKYDNRLAAIGPLL